MKHTVRARPPRVLLVAGLDPSGGAGLAADLEALSWVGVRGWPVASAITAQGPGRLGKVEPLGSRLVLEEIEALLVGNERPLAVKIGMLGAARLSSILAARLERQPLDRIPVVVDPVLVSSSGLKLMELARKTAGQVYGPLLARARVATPNLPELEALTGRDVSTEEGSIRAARELPARAVLVKGGHREGPPVDLLVEGRRVTRLIGRRRSWRARGTGCRLASALAGLLARGEPLESASRAAKSLVERYLDDSRPSGPRRPNRRNADSGLEEGSKGH